MKLLVIYLALSAFAMSAEIMSWRAPLSKVAAEGVKTPGMVRLDKPPEESPFFKKGDEIWDLSPVVSEFAEKSPFTPDWKVWNATSGRLVAKGSWSAIKGIERMYGLDELPRQCRVRMDLFKVPEDGSPPKFSATPDASLSLICRSGQVAKSSISNDNASIHFEAEPTLDFNSSLADLRILVSASLSDSPTVEVETATTLRDRASVWIARDFDKKSGVDIRISLNVELADGTSQHEAIQIQEGNTILAYPINFQNFSHHGKVAIENKGWLVWESFSADSLHSLLSFNENQEGVDPFAATEKPRIDFSVFKEVQPPTTLAQFMGVSVFDLSDAFKRLGIEVSKDDFAGYDLRTGRIFFYSANEIEHDKFEQLFSLYHCGSPSILTLTARGDGQMRLLSRSGQKALLKSTNAKSKRTRQLEIEPTIGETDSFVDLRLLYEEKSGEKVLKSLNTSALLEVGKFLSLMDKNPPNGSMEFKIEKLDNP